MTLELLATNQKNNLPLHNIPDGHIIHPEHMVKDHLSELQLMLNAYQSDFPWR